MRSAPEGAVAVCLLAGGEATRFPGKLERLVGGMPLLRRTYESVREIGPVFVSVRTRWQTAPLDGAEATVILDDAPGTGPLGGLIATFSAIDAPWVFVIAGDAPFAGRELFESLRAAAEPGCEAVVPVDVEGIYQPLCALYERTAFLREARRPEVQMSGAVRLLVEGLRAVRVRNLNERAFFNVNTEADYRNANEDTR